MQTARRKIELKGLNNMTQSRALRRVATRRARVVHNFCAHARVRRTATTPIVRVFGSKYKIYD